MRNSGSRIEMKRKNKNSGINTISRDIIHEKKYYRENN